MRYLDEDISFEYTSTQTGYYLYIVSIDDATVYKGNMYCVQNQSVTVDITDILANYRFMQKLDKLNVDSVDTTRTLIKTVTVTTGSQTLFWQEVCFAYRYISKNYENYLTQSNKEYDADIMPCLQSSRYYKGHDFENLYRTDVLPHIPLIRTDKFAFVETLYQQYHDEKGITNNVDFHYILNDEIVNSFVSYSQNPKVTITKTTPLSTLFNENSKPGVLSICHSDIDNIKSKYDINIVNFYWTKGSDALTLQQKSDFLKECTKEFGPQRNALSNLIFSISYVSLPTPVNAEFNSQQEAINAFSRVSNKIPTIGGFTMSIRPIWRSDVNEQSKEQTTDEMISRLKEYFKNVHNVEFDKIEWKIAKKLWFEDDGAWFPSYKFVDANACNRLEDYLDEQVEQGWYHYMNQVQCSHNGVDQVPAFVWDFNPYIKSTEVHHNTGIDYLNESTLNCVNIWTGTTYENKPDEIIKNKMININYTVDWLQVGFQYKSYGYSETYRFDCDGDTHILKFVYNKDRHYRFEFSFRDNGQSGAKNGEVAFVQWNLENAGLVEGNEYTVKFSHTKSGYTATVYSFTMTENVDMPVAIVDECPSRYYLMWQDRLGGVQIQRFNGKNLYKEDFEKQSIVNFQGHKKNISTQIQSKWELHTGFVEEDKYPIYESIFVSPDIILYDTEIDKSYRVCSTGKNYTEKTHKNQRNLFKLTIEVELDKKQNILG